jgi:transposase, IS5 family
MAHRRIGQERLGFGCERANPVSSLDEMAKLIDWTDVARGLGDIYTAAKGQPGWPLVALFRALLLATWYDLSDVKLAEALADRASFRRFCGFSATEPTPERCQARHSAQSGIRGHVDADTLSAALEQSADFTTLQR